MNNLKELREAKGLTVDKLAELSGVAPIMIKYYEKGTKDLSHAHLSTGIKLADCLGVHPKKLLQSDGV